VRTVRYAVTPPGGSRGQPRRLHREAPGACSGGRRRLCSAASASSGPAQERRLLEPVRPAAQASGHAGPGPESHAPRGAVLHASLTAGPAARRAQSAERPAYARHAGDWEEAVRRGRSRRRVVEPGTAGFACLGGPSGPAHLAGPGPRRRTALRGEADAAAAVGRLGRGAAGAPGCSGTSRFAGPQRMRSTGPRPAWPPSRRRASAAARPAGHHACRAAVVRVRGRCTARGH
jgi:hypothetical protein